MGSILAHSPAFIFKSPLFIGHLEFVIRPTPGDGVGRVKFGKMLADDFLGIIAFDTGSAGVPAHDVPGWVQKQYRVVLDAIHHLHKLRLLRENSMRQIHTYLDFTFAYTSVKRFQRDLSFFLQGTA